VKPPAWFPADATVELSLDGLLAGLSVEAEADRPLGGLAVVVLGGDLLVA
jgi:hypothetical protein